MNIIVTHFDLDGVAAGICLEKYLKDCKTYFVSRHKMWKILKKLRKKERLKIFVCDHGINKNERDKIQDILKPLAEKNELYWFDHHVWDKETEEEVKKLCKEFIVDRTTCAAGVVYKWLKSKGLQNEFLEKLVKLAEDIDLWIRQDELAYKLSLALNKKRKKVVEKLRKEILWDKEIEKYFQKAYNEMKKIAEKIEKKRIEKEIKNILIAIYPLKKKYLGYVSYLTEILKPADVYVFVTEIGSVHMRWRGKSGKVNLAEVAKKLGGGGHPSAAGGKLRYSIIDRIKFYFGKIPKIEKIFEAFM